MTFHNVNYRYWLAQRRIQPLVYNMTNRKHVTRSQINGELLGQVANQVYEQVGVQVWDQIYRILTDKEEKYDF